MISLLMKENHRKLFPLPQRLIYKRAMFKRANEKPLDKQLLGEGLIRVVYFLVYFVFNG